MDSLLKYIKMSKVLKSFPDMIWRLLMLNTRNIKIIHTPWELVDYCHTLGEWEDPHGSSIPLSIESIIDNSVGEDRKSIILNELLECSLIQKNNYKLEKRLY
ncbi:MAG: hypothetical protein ACI4NI_05540 [Candidatus Ornithospirochaeta sp.]